MNYKTNFQNIEAYSKSLWDKLDVYKTIINKTKKKKVILDFFPYPSGVGLHIGHTLGYIATDIYSRFNRLKGYNVLHSMGYDAFGLPAEQFAIEHNEHPSIITYKNIANIKSQLKNLGLDHDESRTFNTTDPDYYKWTQFIFIKLYNSYFDEEEKKAKPIEILIEKLKKQNKSKEEIDSIVKENRLAYLGEVKVNWCPKLGTVLSNEEIIGGLSERGAHPVFLKPLKQWVLRITKYAERLVENLYQLDWPLSVKEMQKNWIGISNGHEVTFNCSNNENLTVYTTRLETLSGVTFIALSKEHPNILKFFTKDQLKEIENKEIFDGIKSSVKAINPITNKEIPIFIADYVLAYGTCAVMSVPSNDERDYLFAKKNNIEIISVISPDNQYLENNKITIEEYVLHTQNYPCYSKYNDLLNKNTIAQEKEILEQKFFVKKKTYTKLRDWIFSRQRYWGEPFPIVLDKEGNPYALEESVLPVELPYLDKIRTDTVGNEVYKPLDDCVEWKNVKFIKLNESTARIIACEKEELEAKKLGKEIFEGTRETNTMPNWAGSCWYYLRYMDNNNDKAFIGQEAKEYWEIPEKLGFVDLYLGGAEHAVLHLLYARFWHMVLYDLNYVNSKEPFQRLFNQGMIQGPSYQNEQGKYFSYKDIEKRGDLWFSKSTNELLIQNIGKIGKRYKNGVTPEEICHEYSIDVLRLFMMYLGPLEQNKPWEYSSIKGMLRVLDKLNNLKFDANYKDSDKIKHEFNIMLDKIEKDFELLKFNTAIAAFIIFLNKLEVVSLDMYKKLIIVLSPIAPHLCEYLYQINLKSNKSIVNENWPNLYENLTYKDETIPLIISLNGKKIKKMSVISNITKEEIVSILEDYCEENKIVFDKIIVPSTSRNAFFANIVKKN